MKRTSLILLAAAIIVGTIVSSSYALDKGIDEEFSSVNSTARVETEHAVVNAYNEVEIPDFLNSDFDRVFEMVASYLNINAENEKMVVWVVDFDTLQEMYPGQKGYPGGSPNTVAALYAPHFNYFFFTPQYMNDYYVAHELIHYFIDEYQEEVIAGLPQVITQKNTTDLSLASYVSLYEEEIVIELSQIIIRKNLASFALRGV